MHDLVGEDFFLAIFLNAWLLLVAKADHIYIYSLPQYIKVKLYFRPWSNYLALPFPIIN